MPTRFISGSIITTNSGLRWRRAVPSPYIGITLRRMWKSSSWWLGDSGSDMNRHCFKNEIFRLKELASEYAEAFPALAPMLRGPTDDPDVERLLEGVAFNTALLRRKLYKDFPDIVNELMQLLFPHYLRPFPPATIVAFSPAPSPARSRVIPAGTRLAGVPVDGTSCTFSTVWDTDIHPLQLTDVTLYQPSVRDPTVRLSLKLNGLSLSEWRPGTLRLFMAGDYVSAADMFMLLCRHLKCIVMTPESGGTAAVLPAEFLKPVGFDAEESLAPYPPHAFPGYRYLQEYFNFHERYLFFDLSGWERWEDRGTGTRFTISFVLDSYVTGLAHVRQESVTLFAVPAANVFAHEADPVLLDHRKSSYLLRPAGQSPAHFQIYSVDSVTGYMRGTGQERSYLPFDLLRTDSRDTPVFHTGSRKSQVCDGYDVHLSVAYPADCRPVEEEVLSVGLTCTNGTLSERLRIGDLTYKSGCLPEDVSARNITPVTPGNFPSLEPDLLRRFSTHLSLNCLSLASAESLRSLLELYIFPWNRGATSVAAGRKRVAGIESVAVLPCEKWVKGVLMRGREIRIKARRDHFGGPGDMYLFGCLLDRFMGYCSAPNVFTVLVLEETLRGDSHQWPPRLGRQLLV